MITYRHCMNCAYLNSQVLHAIDQVDQNSWIALMLLEFCQKSLAHWLEPCLGQHPNDFSIKCCCDVSIGCRGTWWVAVSLLKMPECQRLDIVHMLIINWVHWQLERRHGDTSQMDRDGPSCSKPNCFIPDKAESFQTVYLWLYQAAHIAVDLEKRTWHSCVQHRGPFSISPFHVLRILAVYYIQHILTKECFFLSMLHLFFPTHELHCTVVT